MNAGNELGNSMAKKKATRKKPARKKAAAKASRTEQATTGLNDRIRELRRVKGAELVPHPGNWREHGDSQLAALDGILAEVGIADAVLAFPADGKGADGDFSKLMLFDGHARASRDPDQEWPVLVTDLTREEADKMLATLDPIGAMAKTNDASLRALLQSVNSEHAGLNGLLQSLSKAAPDPDATGGDPGFVHHDQYGVIVMCESESHQRDVFDQLTEGGMDCRVVTV